MTMLSFEIKESGCQATVSVPAPEVASLRRRANEWISRSGLSTLQPHIVYHVTHEDKLIWQRKNAKLREDESNGTMHTKNHLFRRLVGKLSANSLNPYVTARRSVSPACYSYEDGQQAAAQLEMMGVEVDFHTHHGQRHWGTAEMLHGVFSFLATKLDMR